MADALLASRDDERRSRRRPSRRGRERVRCVAPDDDDDDDGGGDGVRRAPGHACAHAGVPRARGCHTHTYTSYPGQPAGLAGGPLPVHVSAEAVQSARAVGAALVGECVLLRGVPAQPELDGRVGVPTRFSFSEGTYRVALLLPRAGGWEAEGRLVTAPPTSLRRGAASSQPFL